MKRLLKIFLVMFKIGFTTFGGGLVMIPQMERDYVHRYGWVSGEDIVDVFAVAQSLPGVIAVNSSILIGYRIAKVKGAVAAVLGAVLPSLLVLIGVAVAYDAFITAPAVLGALRAVRASVVALLCSAAWGMRRKALSDRWFSCAVALAAFALALFTRVNVIFIIVGGAAAGVLRWLIRRGRGRARA
ncbi:MAG: chromate transporter [Oscillospiraceae bacterium]|jgi:chromate transporter|nr:chromate transporter [Oscillospiraceae bacterium]